MTEIDKIEEFIKFGYTADCDNGIIYGNRKKPITRKNKGGYIVLRMLSPKLSIMGHRFIWYLYTKTLPDIIDHIDGDTSNNKISNLRSVSHQENCWNKKKTRGYYFHKINNKWVSNITINRKVFYLGSYDTEEEARHSFLDAKKKYHNITL